MHRQRQRAAAPNRLYYGDNLEVLPTLASESVDLIYLDPPFNSQQDYNLLFREFDGSKAAAQRLVFTDTWSWKPETAKSFRRIVDSGGEIAKCMLAMRAFLGDADLMAYLVMMAPRLSELHRVLKSSGSLYLHCDPTASHYLKVLLDAVFGPANFRNEIVWKRRVGSSSAVHKSNRFGACTDTLLFYAKTADARFFPQYNRESDEYQRYVAERFKFVDDTGRRFRTDNLANPARRPNLIYEYKGYKPPANGWAISREKMEQWDREGRLYFPRKKDGRIARKRFMDELKGMPVQNLWTDLAEINSQAQERLGYPTQKPEALLERIISASSSEGDVVLDPFCGCGTTIAVAHRLKRRWIGIDVTARAIEIIENRLKPLEATPQQEYSLHGKPLTLEDARRLAADSGYQFQRWILELMDVLPRDIKPGADGGIDGRLYFIDAPSDGRTSEVVFSVKGGKNIGPDPVRSLAGVTKGRAKIGVFVCFRITDAMLREAANAEPFVSIHGEFPSLQILTVAEILAGKRPQYPGVIQTATKPTSGQSRQLELKPSDQPSLYGIGTRMAKATLETVKQPKVPVESKRGR